MNPYQGMSNEELLKLYYGKTINYQARQGMYVREIEPIEKEILKRMEGKVNE
jgi:hypothetical protein